MKYDYNYDFSQKVRKNKTVFLIICMLLGLLISVFQMIPIFDIKIILISLILTVSMFFLLIYFILYKNWHKDRSNYSLILEENNFTIHDIHGKHEININEISKAQFRNKNNKVMDIILYGNKKYKINNYFDNIESISIEIKKILEKANIQIEQKKNSVIPSIVTAIVVLAVFIMSYYIQYTSNSQLIRSLADRSIPIAGAIILLFIPKQEKGFIRGNRKYILSALLIFLSVVQIISENT